MVIDSSSDRFLSNPNKGLPVIGKLNGFASKSPNSTNGQPVNIPANGQPFNSVQRPSQPSHPPNHTNNQLNPSNPQHNHTNNCLNQHNHHNHIRGECNRVPARLPNDPDGKMNSPTAFNDKANLLQNNSLLKDSNQSINLPILGKPLDDSEDENDDILEISPCGRWSKRREQVEQHDIPNLDNSYLAIDGEEGLEVVWNEVRYSERKSMQSNDTRLSRIFNRLVQLNHNNIVHIHKYWIDKENPRLIFITEYMSGGTLRLFLKKTRSSNVINKMTLMAWRRWCTQILCALKYLHSQKPKPIIHTNLNCDTIFISHTGLIKIGCICPETIHQNVKTMGANTMANIRLLAPEIIKENPSEETISDQTDGIFSKSYSPAIDIYAFGIVALEMAVLGIKNNPNCAGKAGQFNHQSGAHPYGGRYSEGSISQTTQYGDLSGPFVSRESIRKAIDLLDNDLQKDFINRCLNEDPNKRPTAKELLFHPIIFEVPCLKVICANKILNNSSTGYSLEQIEEEFNKKMQNRQSIIAEIHHRDGTDVVRRICDLSKLNTEYLEKFFEEVRNGVYPLYAFSAMKTKQISKFMKMKRNSTFKNLVENAANNLNAAKEPPNGVAGDPLGKQPEGDETNEENGESGQHGNEPNVNAELSRTDDPEYEEDEYDQEEETGSQTEDYEGRCENCSNDSYEEETRRIEHIEITLSSLTTGQVRMQNDRLYHLDLLLKLDDKMNRKLSCSLSSPCDNGTVLSNELVANGFINSKDRDLVEEKIDESISKQKDFTELAGNQSIACCYSNAG